MRRPKPSEDADSLCPAILKHPRLPLLHPCSAPEMKTPTLTERGPPCSTLLDPLHPTCPMVGLSLCPPLCPDRPWGNAASPCWLRSAAGPRSPALLSLRIASPPPCHTAGRVHTGPFWSHCRGSIQLREGRSPVWGPQQETQVRPLGWEDPLEEGRATLSSALAWSIPWTEEPGGLQSTGSQSRTRLSQSAGAASLHRSDIL
ncbi:unnamed protein product [Rangifer tarandus platyrhynchus]|uniref:Uncharacterized protein n=1 Tax=Rangifer tarandus platyrhynchus TaxID=3082113 RepID=A0AC59ZB43_RANTA